MKTLLSLFLIPGLLIINNAVLAAEENIEISPNSTLSIKEVDAYLTGKSLDFAKTAEIHHYPSPKQVLKLENQLSLAKPQINRTIMLNKLMRKYTIKAGREIVIKERQLYKLFAEEPVNLEEVEKLVKEIAALKGEIRFIHLKTNVSQKALLNEYQVSLIEGKNGKAGTLYAFDE